MRSYTLSYPLKIALGTIFIALWVLSSHVANADSTQVLQGSNSDYANSSNYAGNWFIQTFYNVTGRIKSVTFSAISSGGLGGTQFAPTTYRMEDVRYCDDVQMTVNCFTETFPDVDLTFSLSNSCQFFTWNIPDGYLTSIPTGKYVTIGARRQTFTEVARICGSSANPIAYSDYGGSPTSTVQAGFDMYAKVTTDANTTPTPTPTTQYIDIISPEYGTTTDNTPIISIHYRTPFTIDFRPTTTRKFVIRDAVTLDIEYIYEETVQANAGENLTINEPVVLTDGSKIISAFYETETGSIYSEIAQGFFNVNTNTYEIATGLVTPNSTPTETQNNCTTFDVGCQFQKALMFLFYPSQAVLDRFSSLWQNISTKKPFGYVTMTIDALTNLDTNSAHAFDLGEIPFQTAIFDPFKLALGSILWAVYAIFFYQRRLKHLDI